MTVNDLHRQVIGRIENQLAYCNEEDYPCYQRSFHTSLVAYTSVHNESDEFCGLKLL